MLIFIAERQRRNLQITFLSKIQMIGLYRDKIKFEYAILMADTFFSGFTLHKLYVKNETSSLSKFSFSCACYIIIPALLRTRRPQVAANQMAFWSICSHSDATLLTIFYFASFVVVFSCGVNQQTCT